MSPATAPLSNGLMRFSRGEAGDGCGCIASRFDAVEFSHNSGLSLRTEGLIIPVLETGRSLRQLEGCFQCISVKQ
jgi:hypothetical protein